MSLCQQEGDDLACKRINDILNQNNKRFVEVINYNSIDRTIELFASAKNICYEISCANDGIVFSQKYSTDYIQ